MKRSIHFLLPIAAVFLFFVVMQSPRPVAAEGVQWLSSWLVDVDFEGNQPNATLTVKVWAVGAGFYAEETVDLSCVPSTGVAFAENQAVFTGLGGIQCTMPDMAALVYAMTDVPEAPAPPFVLPEECDCKKGAYALADLDLDENNTNQDWTNPVFQMADLAMATPIEAGMGKRPFMTFTVDGQASTSSIFYGAKADVSAQFDAVTNMPDLYNVQFNAQDRALDATPENINQALAISTEQTVLHIGYSPITGEALHGRLQSLTIDPGCFGVD